ncbi:hypothetical protein OG824_35545 [Streptomyces prunicolor]|nr:hypothetical protein [Streptomyces prunicolor]MCX5240538.1 hypothetical protein [Streptomyces prunicolor]
MREALGHSGEDSSLPMAVIMLIAVAAAGVALVVLARPWEEGGEPAES